MALWKSSLLDDGRVEQQVAGTRLHRARLVVRHALEHLEFHAGFARGAASRSTSP